ncbi:MAG: hypothetical protein WC764_00265 [Candidatus Paceibacterota bacterium]|jgi:tetrahydromethanopterin S-methyltransferase subunit G
MKPWQILSYNKDWKKLNLKHQPRLPGVGKVQPLEPRSRLRAVFCYQLVIFLLWSIMMVMSEASEEKISHIEETVDKLAVMMANGFSGVNQRLDKVDERLQNLEADMTQVKRDVAFLKVNSVSTLDHEELVERVDKVEKFVFAH